MIPQHDSALGGATLGSSAPPATSNSAGPLVGSGAGGMASSAGARVVFDSTKERYFEFFADATLLQRLSTEVLAVQVCMISSELRA